MSIETCVFVKVDVVPVVPAAGHGGRVLGPFLDRLERCEAE